jgi:hypothetical protein
MFFGKAPHRGNYVTPTVGITDTPPRELERVYRGNYRNSTEKISKALDTAEGIRHKRITEYNRRSKMTNTPKLWKDMTAPEKGELLLARHNGETLQSYSTRGWSDLCRFEPWVNYAYRIKPKAPKVETFTNRVQLWDDEDVTRICYGHGDELGKISNITHTYTITDGVVTSCDTIIHNNEEADQ